MPRQSAHRAGAARRRAASARGGGHAHTRSTRARTRVGTAQHEEDVEKGVASLNKEISWSGWKGALRSSNLVFCSAQVIPRLQHACWVTSHSQRSPNLLCIRIPAAVLCRETPWPHPERICFSQSPVGCAESSQTI